MNCEPTLRFVSGVTKEKTHNLRDCEASVTKTESTLGGANKDIDWSPILLRI